MSRTLKISDSNYKLSVANGGTITFDPGSNGVVTVTGNLRVLGATTSVETSNLEIDDNLIVLNKGDSGPGVIAGGGLSGIDIYRGSSTPSAQILYKESTDTVIFNFSDNALIGIETKEIKINGTTTLIADTGTNTGALKATGVTDYWTKVVDDDHLANKRYVDEAILDFFESPVLSSIGQGDSLFSVEDAFGPNGITRLVIDGVEVATWTSTEHNVNNIKFANGEITATNSTSDLILRGGGAQSVAVDDVLKLLTVNLEPITDSDGVKLYSKPAQFGGSGVYFVNTDSTKDELISKNKALAYSYIF